MAEEKKKAETPTKKTYWHLYSLQTLQSEKLIQVINKVLKRDYRLIK